MVPILDRFPDRYIVQEPFQLITLAGHLPPSDQTLYTRRPDFYEIAQTIEPDDPITKRL